VKARPSLRSRRLRLYRDTLGSPDLVIAGDDEHEIDVCVFGRNFKEECEPGRDQNGYVLITNGMSDRPMNAPAGATRRAELVWYTRDARAPKLRFLEWLATVPFIDDTAYGFAHTMQLPVAPFKGCAFKKLLFLTPIIRRDAGLATKLARLWRRDSFELLTIHLISDAEHRFVRQGTEQLHELFDLFDANNYPRRFDPKRKSYV
jgi:hypothetical protein